MNNKKPIKDLDFDIALARADHVDKAVKKKLLQSLKKSACFSRSSLFRNAYIFVFKA